MRSLRVGITAAVAVSTAVLMSACGGGEPAASGPTSTTTSSTTTPSSTTSSTTSTTTTTTTKAPPPLSKFEGQAPVKGLRAWAAAAAKSITANDPGLKATASFATKSGLTDTKIATKSDLGLLYPGPIPLTPTKVSTSGQRAVVQACIQAGGWGQNPKTKLPKDKRIIAAADFHMVKQGGSWKLEHFYSATRSCVGVSVKGVAF